MSRTERFHHGRRAGGLGLGTLTMLPLLLLLSAGSGPVAAEQNAAAAGPISEIRLLGNKRTQDRIILQELFVEPGDVPTPALLRSSEEALLDLGLFREVELTLAAAAGEADAANPAQVLTVRVRERHYFLPVPRLDRRQEGDWVYGAQLRFDNLAGLNQRLRVGYRVRDYADRDVKEHTTAIDYSYPRMLGTTYQANINLSHSQMPEVTLADLLINGDEDALFSRRSQAITVSGSRWLNAQNRPIGLRAGLGIAWRLEDIEPLGDAAIPDDARGRAVGLLGSIENETVRELLFTRIGTAYGYQGEVGDETLGDYGYSRHQFHYRRYQPLRGAPNRSLEMNLELGLSHGRVFGREPYSMGGGGSLRGYQRDAVTGEAYLQANFEFLTPAFGYNPIRAAAFIDFANAYPSNSRIDPTKLKVGGGIGLRWRILAFVDTHVGLDVAYGDGNSPHVYGYTSAAF